ncbi:putative reverse transcriptase domain, reverse transcriptase zinc-binding domain protein, partial [Tanacetum coccineum]
IKEVVSDNQSAFVSGRRISDNILITQELMHNYHRDGSPPRCAFKVDIQKAYDTVDWEFLGLILKCFGFHPTMVQWIMACVTSTSFSLSLNGVIHGYFKGRRGLRQGDPISAYLFTLVMEVLTLIIQRRVRLSDSFCYHNHCEELQIINVYFVDDLFIFARGEVESARLIMDSLDEFKRSSGLVPSIPKSTAYFCNVRNHIKIAILSIMPFFEGELPVKYLGVPLISSRLLNKDCKILVEKAKNWIGDWKNKSLSFVGRLQLCKSVISSMHVYWASVLIIPKGIIHDIQQLIRGFLWCNGEFKRGKAKVAWDDICLPIRDGGLGIRNLKIFNIALMTTHIWNIVSNKESLWVWWIHMYKLKGRTIWDIPLKADMSWGWLKLLQLRDIVKPFFWTKLGNGNDTSLWYDTWCSHCPLIGYLSPRDIMR